MLTLADLKKVGTVEGFHKNYENVFLVPELGGITTHVLKLLMYRLENNIAKSRVYLLDTGKVTAKDISTGAYVDGDEGKSRSAVLMSRYSGVFDTEVYIKDGINNQMLASGERKNIILLVEGEGSTAQTLLDRVKTLANTGYSNQNVFIIEYKYVGDELNLQTMVIQDRNEITAGNPVMERVKGRSLPEQYVYNAISGQAVFNTVNAIITKDMTYNYGRIYGNLLKGETKKTYLKKLSQESLYRILVKKDIGAEGERAEEIDNDFQEFRKENEKTIKRKMSVQERGINVHALANYTLLVGKVAEDYERTASTDHYLRRIVDLVRARLNAHEQGADRLTVAKMREYMLVVAYVESKVGRILW